MSEEAYSNIREILSDAIGKRIIDITQHDAEEFQEDGRSYVMLMLDDGGYLKFFVGDDGFVHNLGPEEDE